MNPAKIPDNTIQTQLSHISDNTTAAHLTTTRRFDASVTGKTESESLINLTCLLREFDSHALVSGISLATIASQDRLFLKHDDYCVLKVKNIANLRKFAKITAALLDRLHSTSTRSTVSLDLLHDNFTSQNFLANLIHLILWFQQAALDIIFHYFSGLIGDSVLRCVSTYPYISASSNRLSNLLSEPSSFGWPYTSGITNTPVSVLNVGESLWQPTTPFPGHHNNPGPTAEPNTALQPYGVPQARQTQVRNGGGVLNHLESNLRVQRRNMQDYPSPELSELSDPVNQTYSGLGTGIMSSPSMPLVKSPSASGSSTSRRSINRDREPLRNAAGTFYCDHADCAHDPPNFARKSEWRQVLRPTLRSPGKHMDKHTRPYVCEEPECENIRGFTYSGGLHRHQREVHRQHGGPRASCMCPYKDCKRSSGIGFSRKENLQEHLRRVHRQVDTEGKERPGAAPTDQQQEPSGAQERAGTGKRRRRAIEDDVSDDDRDDDNDDEGESWQDLKQQVKKLRRALRDRDERLSSLEERFEELTRTQRA
ncbi:MAG: hypothetical protein Q9163_003176 [Psora crenata]